MNQAEIQSTADTLYEQLTTDQICPSRLSDELNEMCPDERLAIAEAMDQRNENERFNLESANSGDSLLPDLELVTEIDANGEAQLVDMHFGCDDVYNLPEENSAQIDLGPEILSNGTQKFPNVDGSWHDLRPNGTKVDFDQNGRITGFLRKNGSGYSYTYEGDDIVAYTQHAKGQDPQKYTRVKDGVWIGEDPVDKAIGQIELSDNGTTVVGPHPRPVTECKDLYATPGDPVKSIRPEAIRQTEHMNTCYFHAALGSLAKVAPEQIAEMITANEDGTFKVKFPGVDKEISVSELTEKELKEYCNENKYGRWVAVLTKAFDQHCKENSLTGSGIDGYSSLKSSLKVLTGKDVDEDNFWLTAAETTENKLKKALDAKLPVTVGIRTSEGSYTPLPGIFGDGHAYAINGMKGKSVHPVTGLSVGHAYGVLEYDEKTKTVTLCDPLGLEPNVPIIDNGKDKSDGVFKISLENFDNYFSTGAYPQAKKEI